MEKVETVVNRYQSPNRKGRMGPVVRRGLVFHLKRFETVSDPVWESGTKTSTPRYSHPRLPVVPTFLAPSHRRGL